MFVGKDLLFLELQKTGGSHILQLLGKFVSGEFKGKHNRLKDEHLGRFVIGSIRNPWDWYVSLWAYGVSGRGAIRGKTTQGVSFHYYNQMLPEYMGKHWLTPLEFMASLTNDLRKPTKKWRGVYADPANTDNFKQWLKMLLSKERRYDVGEGYAFSPVSNAVGLMTYRYLRLFTLGNDIYHDKNLRTIDGIRRYDEDYNIANAMIRMENLEEDFVQALTQAGISLSGEEIDAIKRERKTNTSSRKDAAYYYDNETIELVAAKERFLIEKYGYKSPD